MKVIVKRFGEIIEIDPNERRVTDAYIRIDSKKGKVIKGYIEPIFGEEKLNYELILIDSDQFTDDIKPIDLIGLTVEDINKIRTSSRR